MVLSGKSLRMLGVFLAASGAALAAGCGDEADVTPDPRPQTEQVAETDEPVTPPQDQRLTDDNGESYTLHQNGDGTETATYDDGRSVTFHRDEDGNLSVLSGMGGLLAGMAAGYFLAHALAPSPGGRYDSARNRYVSTGKPRVLPPNQRTPLNPPANGTAGKTAGSAAQSGAAGSGASSSSAKPSLKKEGSASSNSSGTAQQSKSQTNSGAAAKAPSGTAKSGFGSAGARSSGGAS